MTHTFPTYDTVDLFAGPGGWSVAAQRLGLREMGIELDKAARQTRRAAGFSTIRDDVRNWGPASFPNATGLIASPPCQTFSTAGKGAGRKALDVVLAALTDMARGFPLNPDDFDDVRTSLVLEPYRWADDAAYRGRPFEWIALEQVPTVLPVWQAMGRYLETLGYEVAVGNLQAEQYGVPQTRKRAVLIARYGKPVELPTPTHSKFHTRNRARLDPGVLPWVSMADALGWGIEGRPSPTITGGGTETGGAEPIAHLSRYQLMSGTRPNAAGASHVDGQLPRGEGESSHTVTGKGTAAWVTERPSPTIVGSFRPEVVAAPGWRKAGDGPRQNTPGSVRVTVQEAAILQSFPPGFPWQGTKTKQYQQVGNAIPPLLAEAILRQVVDTTTGLG